MLTWEIILITAALIFLIIASYSDLKKREVPDWLNYGLIFSALGLRFIFSFENGWTVFFNGLFGLLICLGIAYFFYFTNQWGGGDSKLLMGMGAVLGLGLNFDNFNFNLNLLWFFIGLLLFGALLGLFWSLSLAVKKWKKFAPEFKKLLTSVRKYHFLVLLLSLAFLILTFFHRYFWPLIILPLGGFYLSCFVKSVEKSCFIKKLDINNLVEGDWLAQEISVEDKKLPKGKAIEKQELWKLKGLRQEGKLTKVLIKEGIPFVPSFLFAYLAVTFGMWNWLLGFLG